MTRFIVLCFVLFLPGAAQAETNSEGQTRTQSPVETQSPDKGQSKSETHDLTQDLTGDVTFLKFAPNVPVIQGFGESLDFSKLRTEPDGRYMEAWLTGFKPSNDALRLYKASLPKYGWTIESEIDIRGRGPVLVFSQKQQRLRITVYADTSDASLLRFEISPLKK